MTISAAQIREARRLMRWSSAWLSKRSHVAFPLVLKAQLDAEIAALDPMAIQAIHQAFAKAGLEFIGDSVRKPVP